MPTQRQLIGNVRGPQGEAGQPVRIIAQTYAYQASSNGTTPPTGPWLPAVPQAGQGEYIWTRNTTTYDDGDDSVTYSVAYQGKDGSYAGESDVAGIKAKVQELEDRVVPVEKGGLGTTTIEGVKAKVGIDDVNKRIDGINDYTTGINLVRGSRDFKIGSSDPIMSSRTDGFSFNLTAYITGKDDDGFSIATLSNASTNDVFCSSSQIKPNAGNVYTISFEACLNTAFSSNSTPILTTYNINSSNGLVPSTSISVTSKDTFGDNQQTGVWRKYSLVVTVPDDAVMFFVRMRCPNPGSVSFKKLCVYEGSINHPIYSPNPFDENDYTTGINLVRGTRDFIEGSIPAGYSESGIRLDGFYLSSTRWKKTVGADGFTFVTASGGTANGYCNSLTAEQVSNKQITVSFEVMFNARPTTDENLFQIRTNSTTTNDYVNLVYARISDSVAGYDFNTIPLNEWVKVKIAYQVPKLENQYLRMVMYVSSTATTDVRHYRKICAYEGNINNPIWSANPFDVAQESELKALMNSEPLFLGVIKSDNLIKESDDLNSYVKAGTYACYLGSIAQSLKNCPITVAFKLFVEYTNGTQNTAYIRQTLVAFNKDAAVYTRFSGSSGSSWEDWRQIYSYTTVRPLEGGGTGANNLDGAKSNLGITALENRVKTLEDQIKLLTQ